MTTRIGMVCCCLLLAGCETTQVAQDVAKVLAGGGDAPLSTETIVAGLKEALRVGTNAAATKTSREGGFSQNARIFIPTPEEFSKVAKALRTVGFGKAVDNFELKLNQAAEHASGQAAPVFIDAVREMTFADAKAILQGGDTAATDYFRQRTGDRLRALYAPIVARHMQEVGAVTVYEDLLRRYTTVVPFAPRPKLDPEEYVTEKALDGLFALLADEEAKIRQDPAARTTELLRTVFGR